uniref:glutathione transferase n=1 Tax=Lutzomyia longipalpis TaxID=7200 RepID=A0A7G3ADA8_LUTLO
MAPMKFYYFPMSPPCRGALLTIRNLKLDIELINVNLREKEQLKEDYLKVNPVHSVPTLDDDGFILWESRAISQYLVSAKAPGSPLYPADPKKRAVVDARLYLDAYLQASARIIFYSIHTLGQKTISHDKKIRFYQLLESMETILEGQEYVAGNEVTLADLALLASISTFIYAGVPMSKYKNILAWYKRCENLPGYQENDQVAKAYGDFLKNLLGITGTWDDVLEA